MVKHVFDPSSFEALLAEEPTPERTSKLHHKLYRIIPETCVFRHTITEDDQLLVGETPLQAEQSQAWLGTVALGYMLDPTLLRDAPIRLIPRQPTAHIDRPLMRQAIHPKIGIALSIAALHDLEVVSLREAYQEVHDHPEGLFDPSTAYYRNGGTGD